MKYTLNEKITSLDYVEREINRSCMSPVNIKVFDYETGKFIRKEVPCGKCLNCRYQHQAQWVKRMQYESMPNINKYVYFITLTYSPDFLAINKNYREETFAIKKNNKWIPLLLCRKHLSLFNQRLHKKKKTDYTYFGTGEYGSEGSRPHFHMILWSNTPFTEKDIEDAWTLRGTLIGRIQFDNLVENGTLHDLRSDSPESLNGHESNHISKYVNKYVCKLDESPLESMKTERLIRLAYRRAYVKTKKYDRPLNRDCTHLNKSENKHLNEFIQTYGNELDNEYTATTSRKQTYYTYPTVEEFFNQFLPYTTCSKGAAIGSRYIEDYVSGTEDLLKKDIYNTEGKKLSIPQSFKREIITSLAPILPVDPITNNTSLSNLNGVSNLLSDIRANINGSYTSGRRFDYKNHWLFTDRKIIYHLTSNGDVHLYNYRNGEFRETIGIDDFENRLNLIEYFNFRRTYSKEVNEYTQSKIDFFNEQVELAGLKKDFVNYRKELLKNKVLQFKKADNIYKFKHKQF